MDQRLFQTAMWGWGRAEKDKMKKGQEAWQEELAGNPPQAVTVEQRDAEMEARSQGAERKWRGKNWRHGEGERRTMNRNDH